MAAHKSPNEKKPIQVIIKILLALDLSIINFQIVP